MSSLRSSLSSNCTLVELKRSKRIGIAKESHAGSNCTLVELKQWLQGNRKGRKCSNCTLVELKFL